MKTIILRNFEELSEAEKVKAIDKVLNSYYYIDYINMCSRIDWEDADNEIENLLDNSILEDVFDKNKIDWRDHYSNCYFRKNLHEDISKFALGLLSEQAQSYFRNLTNEYDVDVDIDLFYCTDHRQSINVSFEDYYDQLDLQEEITQHKAYFDEFENKIKEDFNKICNCWNSIPEEYDYYDKEFCKDYIINNEVYFDDYLCIHF